MAVFSKLGEEKDGVDVLSMYLSRSLSWTRSLGKTKLIIDLNPGLLSSKAERRDTTYC